MLISLLPHLKAFLSSFPRLIIFLNNFQFILSLFWNVEKQKENTFIRIKNKGKNIYIPHDKIIYN